MTPRDIADLLLKTAAAHMLPPGVTDAELSACEAEVGLPIPDSYKQFLRFANGAVLYETEELLGTSRPWDLAETIAEAAAHLRSACVPLPPTLLPFYASGGRYFCFDVGKATLAGIAPVVEWEEGRGPGPRSYASFTDWFEAELYLVYHARYTSNH